MWRTSVARRESHGQILVAWSHRVGSLRIGDQDELLGIDFHPGAYQALLQLADQGFDIRVALLTRAKTNAKRLKQLLPRGWTAIEVPADDRDQGVAALCKFATEGVFIAADRTVRAIGAKSGLTSWPDPRLAVLAQLHGSLAAVTVAGDLRALRADREFVPYFVELRNDGRSFAIGVATRAALGRCVAQRMETAVLPIDLQCEDPLLVHLDRCDDEALVALQKAKVLHADGRRVLVAVGPDMANDDIGMHGAHGHYLALAPDPGLWDRAPESDGFDRSVELALRRLPAKAPFERVPFDVDIVKLLTPTCPVSATQFETDSNRYTGVVPLDSAGAIVSRHYRHADNTRAVDALMLDLLNMGYCPYRHEFTHNGRTLHNVIADLPGRGRFIIKANIWKALRKALLRYPWPDPPDPWLKAVAEILGREWVRSRGFDQLPPLQARWRLERELFLYPWYPWWWKLCPLYGIGAKLVIVGCHLDSTANFTPGYVPESSTAPGTDDDASGLVATLSMARWFRNHYAGRLTNTVRFCFFNAEESGLIGSKAYASMLKSYNAPVRAVVCNDMIGYNSDANRIFEVHAGYTDAAVRDASVPIADCVAAWAAALGALAPAQIYKGTNPSGGADRNVYDGAINRSDHAAFHEQGYAAALASEDFFANLTTEPGNDPNPDYHRQTDTTVDYAYAADITCAVANAVKELAA